MMRLERQREIVSANAASKLMNLDEHSLRTVVEVSPIERRPAPAEVVSHM
jgi:hypothetical protein